MFLWVRHRDGRGSAGPNETGTIDEGSSERDMDPIGDESNIRNVKWSRTSDQAEWQQLDLS